MTSVCPAADVITLVNDPSAGIVLYDVANDKALAELHLHPKFSNDWNCVPKWTADGRYLCYPDFKEGPVAASGLNLQPIVHVYDRTVGKEIAIVEGAAAPAGPGPMPTTMVLAVFKDRSPSIAVYDAATGRSEPHGGTGRYPLDACGKQVLYIRLDTKGVFIVPLSSPAHKD